jgi:acyl-CoA synthetase (AMP-forming)/AMP-acid ligase II
LENLVAAAPKCPSLKAAILTTPALSDHHRHLARKGGGCVGSRLQASRPPLNPRHALGLTRHHPTPVPPWSTGLKLYSILDLERLGFRYPQPHSPPDPQDVATFSYTSGTTGGPKGALLTHSNFLCVYAAGKALEVENFPDDVHFSYLPLPHVFERVMLLAVLGNGAAMGFWQGSPEKLVEDLQVGR